MLEHVNDSCFLGTLWTKNDTGYEMTVIWHEARGSTWPSPKDFISFVWSDDGNMGGVVTITFEELMKEFHETCS